MLRVALAVIVGIAVWALLWVGSHAALSSAMPGSFDDQGITTNTGLHVVSLVISVALSVLAGWTTARISNCCSLKPIWVLAVIELAIGISVQTGVWDQMPLWYHLVLLAFVIPFHLLGGRLGLAPSAA